jgi:hypothetical protein
MSTAVTPPLEPTTPGLSEPQRILNIYTSPSTTFNDIRRNASWWAPWILFSIFSIIFVTAVDKKITWDRVAENAMANMSDAQKARMEQAPPEAQAQQRKIMTASFKYISYAFPIVILIGTVIIAAVLMGVFNFGFGAEIPFKQAFAVVMYGSLPRLASSALAIIIVLLIGNPDNFNFENPVPTNPAVLVDSVAHPGLYRFLVSFDIIAIWTCIVLGIGFAVVSNSKVKRNTAIMTMLGLYFIWNFAAAGLKAL